VVNLSDSLFWTFSLYHNFDPRVWTYCNDESIRWRSARIGSLATWGGGGYALCGTTDKGPCGNLKVALAGPLTQFPQGAIWYGFYVLAAGGKHCFSYFVFPRRVERELLYLQCFSATQLLRMLIYLFLTCYRLIHLMEGGASVPSF
jgi:hypothetical protein